MTEDEARTKWCPMAAVGFGSANRGYVDEHFIRDTRCIGSDCMMWVEESAEPITNHVHGRCGLTR